ASGCRHARLPPRMAWCGRRSSSTTMCCRARPSFRHNTTRCASTGARVVNADYFSGRFTTNTFFEAGTYRFYILADDGVRMFVDLPTPFVPVIDTFGQPHPGETLTVDVELAGGYHHLQVELK